MIATPRPYILAETNWQSVRTTDYQVAVLPWGATEAHNYHLPYATDSLQNEHVVAEAARHAWEAGSKVIVLPNVPFGINTGQLDIKLCLNVLPSTQMAILKDLVDVVHRAGIRRMVILNGHGGNHFKNMIREMSFHFPDLFLCALNWFQAADATAYFDAPGDHAGELETSAMLHIAPQWVMPLETAGDGAARTWAIPAMQAGWITAQRQWTEVTQDTGVGNPALATAEKGAAFLQASAQGIGTFLHDLAQAPALYQ